MTAVQCTVGVPLVVDVAVSSKAGDGDRQRVGAAALSLCEEW